MQMRVFILSSLFSLLLCLQSGCSIGPTLYVTADSASPKEPTDVRLMRSDNRPDMIEVTQGDYGSLDFIRQTADQMDQKKICRIKYHKLYHKNRYIVIEGGIGIHGSRYPVVLDTGASQPIFLNVSHVLENKLPIYPMEDAISDLNGHKLGLCYLPLLRSNGR